MSTRKPVAAVGGGALVALALVLTPAIASQGDRAKAPSISPRANGGFTPAVSDPRLAAALARRGATSSGEMRLTPATSATSRDRSVRVAIRARASGPEAGRAAADSTSPLTAITPSSYNLGMSVGWRRFALAGDVGQSEGGVLPGSRESAQASVSYRATRNITGRLQVGAERTEGTQRILTEDEAYSVDLGGSFSIARNVDLTGGVQYRISRDRIEPLSRDDRRDSQAVYIGTAFRF